MPNRVMFIHLKTGFNGDDGPSWISNVRFTGSWATAYWRGRTLDRTQGLVYGNFIDLGTGEQFWLSGPKRDRTDARYSNVQPTVDSDVADLYHAFLQEGRLPGR